MQRGTLFGSMGAGSMTSIRWGRWCCWMGSMSATPLLVSGRQMDLLNILLSLAKVVNGSFSIPQV